MAKNANKAVATPSKRSKKPMGISSITNILKRIHGVLNVAGAKESITGNEKLDLQIARMYLNTLNETIDSILQKNVVASTVAVQSSEKTVVDDDDDEDEDEE